MLCSFSKTGHIEFEVADFSYTQEGQSRGDVDLDRLGFFINPIEQEGKLELDLAQASFFSSRSRMASSKLENHLTVSVAF